jgi:DNA polymerase III sliding clamp (beta) subunit (PCNA family)
VVEQATHLCFSGTDVATFNDMICVIVPFKTDISYSIKESDFSKIVDKIDETDFELTLEDENLLIKSKKTKAKLSTVVGETALVTHLIEDIKQNMIGKGFWKPLPKDFTDGLYLTSFSASKDLTTGIRSCCAIRKDGIYTTDNIRISNYIMEGEMEEILLPAKDASELVKYKVVEYGVSENWAHFRTADGVIFNCKVMRGDYPFDTLDSLFVDAKPTLSFPADLKESVESVITLAEGEGDSDKSILLTVEKGKITCKAERERGWITKTVESDYLGEKFEMLINPVFLAAVLNHATEFTLLEGKGQFQCGNFYHLLALPEVG